MKNLTDDELVNNYEKSLLRKYEGHYRDQKIYKLETLSRLAKVSELEAENSVLREQNLGLNDKSIKGQRAIEKLERISKLPFRNDVAEILVEEG